LPAPPTCFSVLGSAPASRLAARLVSRAPFFRPQFTRLVYSDFRQADGKTLGVLDLTIRDKKVVSTNGYLADIIGNRQAYWVLVPCYVYILYYAMWGHRVGKTGGSEL
jgi:hypothetical protein